MPQLAKFTKQRAVRLAAHKGRFVKQRLTRRGSTTTTLPTLTSITPATGTAAGTALTVTCTGTNFVTGVTKVMVAPPGGAGGGRDQSTTFVSATSVTFSFPRPAIAGVYVVNVHNGEKYSTTPRTLTLT